MQSNVKKLYAISAFEGLVLFYAFDKIYLQLNGLTIVQVIFIEVIYIVTILLLEVPSGVLSDRWSRKYVLSLSGWFFTLYVLAFAAGNSFVLFAIGSLLAGIGTALVSGTDTALLFDTLKESGKENHYEKYLGRKRAIGSIAFIVAALLGGLIGQRYGLEIALWLSLPSMIATALIALTLNEPRFHRSTGEVKYWQHAKQTLSFLAAQPRFLHFGALITIVAAPALLVDEYAQVYFASIGFSALALGAAGALSSFADALFSTIAFRFKVFRHDVMYGLILVLYALGFLSAWWFENLWGAALLFAGSFTFIFIVEILAMADINRQLPSQIRATSESFFGLASYVLYVILALGFGFISQSYSAAAGFGAIGLLLLCYVTFYWLSTARAIDSKGKVE